MKARQVRGLDTTATLTDNARRIVRVRLDELYSFAPRALDPEQAKALHDMRIAAKRLRYVLELTGFCFGPYAAKAAGVARDLQDLIGEIHDCDVLEPRIIEHLATLRAEDAQALSSAAIAQDADVPHSVGAERRQLYAALEALAVDQRARRRVLFARFTERWEQLQNSHFRKRLLDSLGQPPLSVAA
jgi:CHAD domain-containing protein